MPTASGIARLLLAFSLIATFNAPRANASTALGSLGQCTSQGPDEGAATTTTGQSLLQRSKKTSGQAASARLFEEDDEALGLEADPPQLAIAAVAFGGVPPWPAARAGRSWLSVPDFVVMLDKPPSSRDLYFRPVSVTLYCVMWLTIQSIVVHTSAAIAQNCDELSAATEPSFLTQVLETAARSVPLAPVMSLLFLANRVYMLESTGGLGEVEPWVKICMMVASLAMTCQLCTVALLALTVERGDTRFSEASGDTRDAHPHISRHAFHRAAAHYLSLALQTLSMLGIYGGVSAVFLGMVLSGRGFDPDSAAVCCTAALVVLYFAVQFALWATNTGMLMTKMDSYGQAVRAAAFRADAVVQKAPMFAVLTLSTRLRQVQEDMPGGTPPTFLWICFSTAVVTLYLEVLLSVAGSDDEGSSPLNYLQYFVSLLGLGAASAVANSIISPWVHELALPMSPTIHSVMMLCMIFFLVHLLLTLYGLARGVLKLTSSRAEDALLAARNSVGFCPLLCTLFLGCRMRALQITQNKGMPQWWEQDFLYLCIGATALEVLCCLAAPAFYKEMGVDQRGNPTYGIESLTGTYVMTLVRYIGLLGLYGGVAGVCLSVFTMTPTSAMGERPTSGDFWKALARAVLWTLFALMIASLLSSAKVVGLIVKLAIESVDTMLLNAEVTVDTAVLSLYRGVVIVKGLVVGNPLGGSFRSRHLFKVELAAVKINLRRLVLSLGSDIEIKELVLNGVDMNYELGSQGSLSNVASLLEFLDRQDEPPPPPPPKEARSLLEILKKTMGNLFVRGERVPKPPPPPPAPPPPAALGLVLQRILIKNVYARVQHPSLGALAGVDLGEIDIPDFSRLSTGRRVGDVLVFILKTVLRTAMSNADIVKHLLQQGTSHVISKVAGGATSCGCGAPMLSSCSRGVLLAGSSARSRHAEKP